jgi:hypothetical protein
VFTGDANPISGGIARFGAMMSAVGQPPLGLEAAQVIGITHWAQEHWRPSHVRIESSGYRMQVVSLVAGSIEPDLFRSITIHKGMHSLNYILQSPVLSSVVPDLFCQDLYKEFDLDMMKTLVEPATVTESDFLESTH